MSEKDNSVPPLSFEIERQARIKRIRGTVRAFAEWLRSLVLRSTQSARRLASKRHIYSDIRELQQFDDRMLADIGVTTDWGVATGGWFTATGVTVTGAVGPVPMTV